MPAARYEAVLDELALAIEAIPGPDGRPMGNRALRPAEV